MSENLKLPLKDVDEWLNKETTSIIEPLKADARELLLDIQTKLEELSEACEKLLDDAEKEMAKASRKTYRRAKALYKLADSFSNLIDKVNIPKEVNGQILNEVSDQLAKTIKTIGNDKTKWFRAIAPYFIMTRRRFEISFKRTEDSFRNFTDFLSIEYSKAKRVEGISSEVEALRQSLSMLSGFKSKKEIRKQKREILEKKIAKTQQKLQAIQSNDEVIKLAQLNLRIEELAKLVKHELRHIEKPLLKFQTLINKPGYNLSPDAANKLDEYLTNPFQALATEKEGYPLLKSILQKINTALNNKKMKLKSTRLRKAKDQLDRIVEKTALLSLQKSCSELFNKKHKLLASNNINKFRDEQSNLHSRLNDLHKRRSIIEARDTMFEKQYKDAYKRVDDQKRSLEKILFDLSNKKVQILLD